MSISTTTPSAVSKVLNTSELLEQVLQHLDCATLLRDASLVSKRWKHLVDTSPLLKWQTWRWDGIKPPLTVRGDDNDPESLFAQRDIKNPFGYELSEAAMLWLRFFWLCLAECLSKSHEDINEIGDAIINVLPRLELFRPRFESAATVAFMFYDVMDGFGDVLREDAAVNLGGDELQLRTLARLILDTAFSEDGWWLGPEVWGPTAETGQDNPGDGEGAEEGRSEVRSKRLDVAITVDFIDAVKDCSGSMTTRLIFQFNEPDLKKIDIEYLFPSGDCTLYELELYNNKGLTTNNDNEDNEENRDDTIGNAGNDTSRDSA
ncbi:hypothetical protein TWF694_002415 [Orbilia ellipsospora]|uniref:F-box domain-containing protein n=1 Tax=Orbilia ellipsospora TaxID=2528407 RepID=A0AAV9X1W5_9PEZI